MPREKTIIKMILMTIMSCFTIAQSSDIIELAQNIEKLKQSLIEQEKEIDQRERELWHPYAISYYEREEYESRYENSKYQYKKTLEKHENAIEIYEIAYATQYTSKISDKLIAWNLGRFLIENQFTDAENRLLAKKCNIMKNASTCVKMLTSYAENRRCSIFLLTIRNAQKR